MSHPPETSEDGPRATRDRPSTISQPEDATPAADGKNASPGWIKLLRSEETLALLENYPNAFLLLTQIAIRAKRKDCQISGLRAGEALIGDWKKAGLHSPKAYQVAKARLEKCGLAAFQGGNKGTRAMLVDSRVFSISRDDRGNQNGKPVVSEGEPNGNQGGTNKNERRKEGYKETYLFPPELSGPMARICDLFGRRHSTKWSDKEIKAFKAIPPEALEQLDLVCTYTKNERLKGDKEGRHRRDVLTFLNYFTGELDRAIQADVGRLNLGGRKPLPLDRWRIDTGGRKPAGVYMDHLKPDPVQASAEDENEAPFYKP